VRAIDTARPKNPVVGSLNGTHSPCQAAQKLDASCEDTVKALVYGSDRVRCFVEAMMKLLQTLHQWCMPVATSRYQSRMSLTARSPARLVPEVSD
jgi:hypothetical protein